LSFDNLKKGEIINVLPSRPKSSQLATFENAFHKGETMSETYYDPLDLSKFPEIGEEAPELAKKFFDYYGAVFAEGALSEREKALIALAVAHAVQCPYCIDAYTQSCLEKGSNLKEMTEAVHVSVAIRGGASLVHGVQMRNAAKKISM
jgi:4-carboxymuconolactone decarboxylase